MVDLTVSRGFSWIMTAAMLLGAVAVQACGDDGSSDGEDDGTSGSPSAGRGGSAAAGHNNAGRNNGGGGSGTSGGRPGTSGATGTSGGVSVGGSGGSGASGGSSSGSGGTQIAGGTAGTASGGTSPEPSAAGAGAGGEPGGQGGTGGDVPTPMGGAGAGGEAGLSGGNSFDGGAGGSSGEPVASLTITGAPRQVPLSPGSENWVEATLVNGFDVPITVSLDADGPPSITITPDSDEVDLGAGETKVIEFALKSTVATGTSEFALLATAPRVDAVTLAFTALHSDDMARNTVTAPFPRPFAKSNQPSQPARLAFDGRADTFWVSVGTLPGEGPRAGAEEELGVDFGTEVEIASVTMTPREGRGPTEYDVQLSDDGEVWRTVETVITNDLAAPVVTPIDPPETAAQLRLFIKGSRDPGHATACPSPCDPRNVQIAGLEVRTTPVPNP